MYGLDYIRAETLATMVTNVNIPAIGRMVRTVTKVTMAHIGRNDNQVSRCIRNFGTGCIITDTDIRGK